MGLLDNFLGSGWDDPKSQAVMALAGGLLNGDFGAGVQGYGNVMANAKDAAMKRKILEMQAAEYQQKMDMQNQAIALAKAKQAALPEIFRAPSQGAPAMSMDSMLPTELRAGTPMIQPVQPSAGGVDVQRALQAGYSAPEIEALAKLRNVNNQAPIHVKADETLVDPSSYRPIYTAPKTLTKPAVQQEYEAAVAQGYKGSLMDYQIALKKAGATNVNVPISMDKGFGETFARDAASNLAASRDTAKAASSNIQTLQRINDVISSGNVAVGPSAPFEMWGRQLGATLGIGGKNNEEVLGNTRKIIQGAAQLAADGSAMLAKQGQITDAERVLISNAAGGNIDRLTMPEMKSLIPLLAKVNALKIQSHKQYLSNVGPQFQAFTPFYQVDMPQFDTPQPQSAGGVISWGSLK